MIMPFPSEVSTSARRRDIRVRGKGIRGLWRFVKYRAPSARCLLVLRASLVVAVSIAVDASIGSRRAVAVQLRTIGSASGKRLRISQIAPTVRPTVSVRLALLRQVNAIGNTIGSAIAARIGSDKRACDGSTAGSGAIYVRLHHRR